MTRSRLVGVLDAVEARTAEPEQNQPTLITTSNTNQSNFAVPPVSEARKELTDIYSTLKKLDYLQVYGAAGTVQHPYYPAEGDGELVSPNLLEKITGFPMSSLTPKNSNKVFLYGGLALCVLEAAASYFSGIPLDWLVLATIVSAIADKLTTNGAILETILKTLYPQYGEKVLKHEAGHFLCAYLLGLPVEGCVLSAWAALEDSRFQNQVTAGTSFFDPELSSDILNKSRVSKRSIDRYSIVVMAGIAAEAMNWDQAEGGAGDEMALAAFLAQMTGKFVRKRWVCLSQTRSLCLCDPYSDYFVIGSEFFEIACSVLPLIVARIFVFYYIYTRRTKQRMGLRTHTQSGTMGGQPSGAAPATV